MANREFPGKIRVSAKLDVRFGEMSFTISAPGRSDVENKCLYDALSIFGVKLDRAKKIVEQMSSDLKHGRYFSIDLIDYRKYEQESEERVSSVEI
jgi:hypothetical protein